MTSDDQGDELGRVLDEDKRLRADNEQLRQRLRDLEAKLEAALRASKRQSAPFYKGEPKVDPKRPGRKSADQHGQHGHRQPSEHVDETVAVEPPCDAQTAAGN